MIDPPAAILFESCTLKYNEVQLCTLKPFLLTQSPPNSLPDSQVAVIQVTDREVVRRCDDVYAMGEGALWRQDISGNQIRYTDSAGFTEHGLLHYRSVKVFIMDLHVSVFSFIVPVCPHSLGKQPKKRKGNKHYIF